MSVFAPASPAGAAGVVGTGTPASCTEAALEAALMGGGSVSFKCGPGSPTIALTDEKEIPIDTTVNGGGRITLDGQHQTRHFYVFPDITLELVGITLIDGNGRGARNPNTGGSIHTLDGTVRLTNSTLTGNVSVLFGGAIGSYGGTIAINNSVL